MAFSQFPAPAAGGAASSSFAATLSAMSTVFEHEQAFESGVYTVNITPSTTQAKLTFVSATTQITTQTTLLGTVSFNLSTPATAVYIFGITGGTIGAVVNVEKTADALTSSDIGNGTLDTVSTTSTYNHTGALGVLVIGGGAGGQRGGSTNGGNGGRAGFINGDVVVTNAATTITVGAAGVGQTPNAAAILPTNSSFGNLVTCTAASNIFTNGNGATALTGDNHDRTAGNVSGVFKSWNTNSTTGGGGSGGGSNQLNHNLGGGAGSGIGTGSFHPGPMNSSPTAATGFGAGGCGASGGNGNELARFTSGGTGGVVYVLRGF